MFADEESSNWSWDNEAKMYYWHRYYRHQPELNFENSEVQLEIIKVVDFLDEDGCGWISFSQRAFLV
jgi:maltose alpha-D-glucosyltransferase/alpha-amylase